MEYSNPHRGCLFRILLEGGTDESFAKGHSTGLQIVVCTINIHMRLASSNSKELRSQRALVWNRLMIVMVWNHLILSISFCLLIYHICVIHNILAEYTKYLLKHICIYIYTHTLVKYSYDISNMNFHKSHTSSTHWSVPVQGSFQHDLP